MSRNRSKSLLNRWADFGMSLRNAICSPLVVVEIVDSVVCVPLQLHCFTLQGNMILKLLSCSFLAKRGRIFKIIVFGMSKKEEILSPWSSSISFRPDTFKLLIKLKKITHFYSVNGIHTLQCLVQFRMLVLKLAL